jgi:two-component system, chemotaxis family, chemotaxis protein CheY
VKTRKVIIVDDFKSIRDIVKKLLENKGYQVLESSNGEEALKMFDGTSYDLLITDYNMPGMSGADLVRKLRDMTQYMYIPVIMLTSSPRSKIDDYIRDLNIACFLQKPFETSHFYSVIEKLT